MSFTGMTQTNPLALPRTIDPTASIVELNPLPPPGRPLDGTADLHPARSGHYPARRHESTAVLGGTISTGGTWTLTVTPKFTGAGTAISDALGPITLTVVVGATETATAIGDLFVLAALAASSITSVEAINTYKRLSEIATITNAAGTLTAKSVAAGATFDLAAVPQAGGTATIVNTIDARRDKLRIGILVVRDGLASDGKTPIVRPPEAGDKAGDVWGIVADGDRNAAIDPELGYDFEAYHAGRDVPILPLEGAATAFAEGTVAAFGDVYVRTVAGSGEVAGAVTDAAGADVGVLTVTPTLVALTVYSGLVTVTNLEDGSGVTTPFSYTSLDPGTVAAIVAGIIASLDDPDNLTVSGTATVILTPDAGYSVAIVSTGVGVLTTVATTPDHIRLGRGRFARATTGAATCAIDFGL